MVSSLAAMRIIMSMGGLILSLAQLVPYLRGERRDQRPCVESTSHGEPGSNENPIGADVTILRPS